MRRFNGHTIVLLFLFVTSAFAATDGEVRTEKVVIRESKATGSNTATLKSPDLSASYTLTLPVDDGTSGQVMSTDGSGVLSWASPLVNPMDSEGDLIVGGASGAATKLDSGVSGTYLKSAGAASPTWSAVDLTSSTSVSGALGAANGGTGVANNAAATLTRSGNHALTLTTTNTTSLTLPTSGTVTALGSDIDLASAEVTGVLPIANGGTGSSTFISQGSFTVVYSGPFTSSGSLTAYYSIIGKVVTLYFPAFATQTASAATAITVTPTSFPAGAYPAAVQDILLVPVRNNGADKATPGVLRMPTSGNFSIFPDYTTSTFTNASTCGIQSNFSVSYRIAS